MKNELSLKDHIKLSLCQLFLKYVIDNKLDIEKLPEMLCIKEKRLFDIMNCRLNKLSVAFILSKIKLLLEIIKPEFELQELQLEIRKPGFELQEVQLKIRKSKTNKETL